MGIRGSKSRSVDITTPGAEPTTPVEGKASANGGTDLQEYHEKKLENGEQHAPVEQKDTNGGEEVVATKSTESKPEEDTNKVEEAKEVKENGGTEGGAVAAAPIANAEKLDNDVGDIENGKADEEERLDDDKKEKKEKAKEDNKKEKKEEERKRKEEEKKRKEEEKKRKEEEKKEKKKDKKRSFSFLQRKKKEEKKEESPNGDADAKEAKPEEIKEEVKVESAEQPSESAVIKEELANSAADAPTETKREANDSTENVTVNESTSEAVAAVAADKETGETEASHEAKAAASEILVEKTSAVEEQIQSPEVTTTISTESSVEAVAMKTEKIVESVTISKSESTEEPVPIPTKREEVETKPLEPITAPEEKVQVTPAPVQTDTEPSLPPTQQPVSTEVFSEIPPPPPTPPLVNESPAHFETAPKPKTPEPVVEIAVCPPAPSPPVLETAPVSQLQEQPHDLPKPVTEIIQEHLPEVTSEEIARPQETEEALAIPPPPLSEDTQDTKPQEQVLIEQPLKDLESGKVSGCYTTELTWAHGGKTVAVRGSFNNWKEPVELLERDGLFVTKLELSAGDHYIKFQVDGDWTVDNDQPIIDLDGEGQVNVLSVKPDANEE